MIWLFRMLDLDSVARYLVFFFTMNLFIDLYKAAKVMKILKKLEIRRIPSYDLEFNLHYFMDFVSNEKWKCFAKNCPIHWSEPFHCQGDIRCVQFPKFCEYFNIPSNSEPRKAAKSNISESKKMFESGIIWPAMNFELHENVNAWDTLNRANGGETNHQMNPNQTVHPIINKFEVTQFPKVLWLFW